MSAPVTAKRSESTPRPATKRRARRSAKVRRSGNARRPAKSRIVVDEHGKPIEIGSIVVADGPTWGRVVAIYDPVIVYEVLGHEHDFAFISDKYGSDASYNLTVV